MRWLKSAYAEMAREIGGWPVVRPALVRAGEADKQGMAFWMASLAAIYDIDRMVELDIPWWNIRATDAVEAFLAARPDASAFEYGSGASTIWLARRAGRVCSIEHEAGWADQVEQRLAGFSHVALWRQPLVPGRSAAEQPYVRTIAAASGPFDLIVVDGRERAACLPAALPWLKPGGIILFDDSGRQRYRAAIEGCGLAERHFFGRSYCVPYPDHTSLIGPDRSQ